LNPITTTTTNLNFSFWRNSISGEKRFFINKMIFTPFLKIICSNSDFSEEVLYYTSGCAPSVPASPVLTKAGVTWLSLQWTKPSGTPSDEGISYILEMEEETSVSMIL
jgi:hypothetical protein